MFGQAHDPGTAIFAVITALACLLVASYPVIKMIGWWADGGAEPLVAMLGIFMYVVLVVWAMAAPAAVGIGIFILIGASAVLAPVFGSVSDQVQLQRIDEGQMRRYAEALEENPMNAAARIALAEALHKKGDLDLAIEHMQWTLERFPSLKLRIRPQLDAWRRERDRRGVPQNIFCHICHAENAYNATECYECGIKFGARAGMKQEVYRAGGPKVVLRVWVVTAGSLIIVVAGFLYLPVPISAPLFLATCMVAAWLFLRWIGGNMGTIGD